MIQKLLIATIYFFLYSKLTKSEKRKNKSEKYQTKNPTTDVFGLFLFGGKSGYPKLLYYF